MCRDLPAQQQQFHYCEELNAGSGILGGATPNIRLNPLRQVRMRIHTYWLAGQLETHCQSSHQEQDVLNAPENNNCRLQMGRVQCREIVKVINGRCWYLQGRVVIMRSTMGAPVHVSTLKMHIKWNQPAKRSWKVRQQVIPKDPKRSTNYPKRTSGTLAQRTAPSAYN